MGQDDAAERSFSWPLLVLLWLLGMDLRLTILAVPPVLPLIHRQLHLDEKMVAALTGLPVLLFGLVAIPGSLLIARLGARRAAIAGILLVVGGSSLRGVGPSVPMLYAMTAVMGAGVAVMQPALPTLVGSWFAARVPLATAVYANGLLISEMLAASLTIPFVLPLLGGSWPASFVFWSVPVLVTAFLVLFATPHVKPQASRARLRWWPDWLHIRTWQLGFMLGGVSALYFGCNAFLPSYLLAIGRPGLIDAGLTALNTGQLPASFLIMLLGRRIVGHRTPFVVMALIGLVSLCGLLLPSAPVMIAAAALVGFAAAGGLILALALPPLLARQDDVHRVAAGMLAIGYSLSFLLPYLGGAIWDATHLTIAALFPGVVGSLIVAAMAATVRLEPAVNIGTGR
jgi:MFS transporter, CP family, cyanate transporter